jgi:RimJ/RimL family protein N-acetyltransferase
MKFQIRKTSEKDMAFYQHCFGNSEFCRNLYGNDKLNLQKYVSNEEKHLKFIISQIDNEKREDVAFWHFYYNPNSNDYDLVGGVAPEFFNLGTTSCSCIAILSYMFENNPEFIFKTGVFKYNQRSLKACMAIGFKPIEETNEKIILKLTPAQFKTEFVKVVLKRIELLQ